MLKLSYQDIDDIITKIIDSHMSLGYKYENLNKFISSSKELSNYLQAENLLYTEQIGELWLEKISKNKNKIYRTYRRTINLLNNHIKHGHSTLIVDYKSEYFYNNIPIKFRALIDKYIILLDFNKDYAYMIQKYCSKIINHLINKDIYFQNDTPYIIIKKAIDCFDSSKNRRWRGIIAKFFNFMYESGEIDTITFIKYKQAVTPINLLRPPYINERLKIDMQSQQNNKIVTINEFDNYVSLFEHRLNINNYSFNQVKLALYALKELYTYLILNNLNFSLPMSEFYLKLGKKTWADWKYVVTNKVLSTINDLIVGNEIPKMHLKTKRNPIPGWYQTELNNYIQLRTREICSKSMKMIRASCRRFYIFLDSKNIQNFSEITHSTVKEFHRTDKHKTNLALNAYCSRIRGFLNYLGEKNIIDPTIKYALPTSYASKQLIIEILSDENINKIIECRNSAILPIELRNVAMVMLGLTVGLRASDIVNIRFSDIAWNDCILTIMQTKTKKRLEIPLPIETANSIWKYIQNGRPKHSFIDYIFITHKAPYTQLDTSTCRYALNRILNTNSTHGFHILRRTFATKILLSGNKIQDIANLLGHQNTSSLDSYLSLDETRMHMCPLNLELFKYQGKHYL
jgi:site-specific recombinase XerD